MEHVLATQIVTKAADDMLGAVVESYSDDTEHKPQMPSKSVVKSSSDTRGEIGRELADVGVMTKAEVDRSSRFNRPN